MPEEQIHHRALAKMIREAGTLEEAEALAAGDDRIDVVTAIKVRREMEADAPYKGSGKNSPPVVASMPQAGTLSTMEAQVMLLSQNGMLDPDDMSDREREDATAIPKGMPAADDNGRPFYYAYINRDKIPSHPMTGGPNKFMVPISRATNRLFEQLPPHMFNVQGFIQRGSQILCVGFENRANEFRRLQRADNQAMQESIKAKDMSAEALGREQARKSQSRLVAGLGSPEEIAKIN